MRTSGASMPAASAAVTSIEDRIFRNKSSQRRLGRRMVFPPSMRLQPVMVAHLRTLRSGGFLLLASQASYAFKSHQTASDGLLPGCNSVPLKSNRSTPPRDVLHFFAVSPTEYIGGGT